MLSLKEGLRKGRLTEAKNWKNNRMTLKALYLKILKMDTGQ